MWQRLLDMADARGMEVTRVRLAFRPKDDGAMVRIRVVRDDGTFDEVDEVPATDFLTPPSTPPTANT